MIDTQRRRPFFECVALALALGLVLTAPLRAQPDGKENKVQPPPKEYAAAYHEPFKGKPKKAEDFALIGGDAAKYVKFEPEGLRIRLPAGQTRQQIGVATTFGLVGNFDVSVRYEILAEPEPADAGTPNVGTRISLTANVGGKNNDASIRRKVPPGGTVHILTYTSADKLGTTFAVKEKTGRFRLVRMGDMVSFYLADGPKKEFQLLMTQPFDTSDLKNIQIFAQTSSATAVLDARFTDLRISAKSLSRKAAPSNPEKVGEPSPAPKPEKASGPQISTKDYAARYDESFKGSGTKPQGWNFTAAAAEEFVRFEPAGLRLIMPAGWPGERRGAGIQTAFGVKGDFEITLNFEFLKEPAPADLGKFATRLLMGVALDTPNFDTPTAEVATLNRSLLSKGERTFTTWMRNGEYPKGVLGGKSATGTTGQLRIVRGGDELFFLASSGADQPFTLIKKIRFGPENIKRVSITGMTGHENAMLDVRLTDFSIRADAILGAPAPGAAAAPPALPAAADAQTKDGRIWLIAGLLVGLTVILLGVLAFGAWFLLRVKGSASARTPTVAAGTALSFACPNCARTLKVKPELAGKKVKCARCGKAVLTPAQ